MKLDGDAVPQPSVLESLHHATNQEKLNTELQEEKKMKNILQEELEKLKTSHHEEKLNSELQEEKRMKNSLQEDFENLEASCHEVCKSHTTNQEEVNSELQEEKMKNNIFQEELEKLKASYHETVCVDCLSASFDACLLLGLQPHHRPGLPRPQGSNPDYCTAPPPLHTSAVTASYGKIVSYNGFPRPHNPFVIWTEARLWYFPRVTTFQRTEGSF
ncbi:unnamed protein product [Pleuronectes platessa]|uniref:Uncharacterized protein n=1 Tax=Pleuronectes platessa TaxID=8262 RepID=A0A9N7VUY3_PLEPL|nr:unnamed protein product [Pleuronectes platessa]